MMPALAWRLLKRELRSGELRLLFAALVLAVAASTAVGFFAERTKLGLQREARQLLGGDLALNADHPIPDRLEQEAHQRGLQTATNIVFPSMVIAPSGMQLADIKAVSPNYPLRGQLGVAQSADQPATLLSHGPAPGEVWIDERLAGLLMLAVGERVGLGSREFLVSGILKREPDRGLSFYALAPRLMMHDADLKATGLLAFGARARYSLLIAGEERTVQAYGDWLRPRLQSGERLEDAGSARPEIRTMLQRTERFLGLAGMTSVILAALAVALASRRYLQRHLDSWAVMRCLGSTQRELLTLHGMIFGAMALCGGLLGNVIGFAAHFVLLSAISGILAIDLPSPGWQTPLQGWLVAFALTLGFVIPPLIQLSKVPAISVIRRELGRLDGGSLAAYLLGFVALSGLTLQIAGEMRLGMIFVGAVSAGSLMTWLVARLLISCLGKVRHLGSFAWRNGVSALTRYANRSTVQVLALSTGLMALMVLTVVRTELQGAWLASLPADAPNRFIINIQPEQAKPLQSRLRSAGIDADLQPMVRARLTHIGQRAVSAASYPDDDRAQRLVEREFNLSWMSALPAGNVVSAGRWFTPDDTGQAVASVEEGLARTLDIKSGDKLRFMIAGHEQELTVTSLRKLSWDSMRVNFFVITPPGVLENAPASYITSFHLHESQASMVRALVSEFPNLTVIDIGNVLAQLQELVSQVSQIIQFLFGFTLATGALVLYAALLAAHDERRYGVALMRALGAQRHQLISALIVELLIIGGLAGALAGCGANAIGQLVARHVLDIPMALNAPLMLSGPLIGALLSMAIGWFAMRPSLASSPLSALRSGV